MTAREVPVEVVAVHDETWRLVIWLRDLESGARFYRTDREVYGLAQIGVQGVMVGRTVTLNRPAPNGGRHGRASTP